MQCVSLVKLMPLFGVRMGRKNTIKNALFSRRKFRTTALELSEQMNGFIKRGATVLHRGDVPSQHRRLRNLEPVSRRRVRKATTLLPRIQASANTAATDTCRGLAALAASLIVVMCEHD